MKKAGFIAVLLFISTLSASACDVCGCASSMGTGFFGINNRSNLIGLRSQYAGFYAFDHLDQLATDQYFQTDIWGQFTFLERFQFKFDLPYGYRHRSYSDQQQRLLGAGDPWVQLSFYPWVKKADEKHPNSHELGIGVGIKAPLGAFSPETGVDGLSPLPANFQLGTGSWDHFFTLSHRWQRDKWGVQTQANSRINRANQRMYQFGHQISAQVVGFRWLERGQHVFRLYGGSYGELIRQDQQFGMPLEGTGGKGVFATAGIEYLRKKIALGFQFTQPIAQQYAHGDVLSRTRSSFSISYFLN